MATNSRSNEVSPGRAQVALLIEAPAWAPGEKALRIVCTYPGPASRIRQGSELMMLQDFWVQIRAAIDATQAGEPEPALFAPAGQRIRHHEAAATGTGHKIHL